MCAHVLSPCHTHTHAHVHTHAHSAIDKKLPGPYEEPKPYTRNLKTLLTISSELCSEHTCFWVLVETAVLGILKQRQALLNGHPNIRLRTQQIRRSILTLKESEGKKTHRHYKHSNFLVTRLHSSRKGFNHQFKQSQPETAFL